MQLSDLLVRQLSVCRYLDYYQ